MLSDEEKTALEFIKINNEHKYCGKDDVDFLLNLIEKQSKEIEELKNITKSYDSFLGTEKIVIADKKFFVNGYFRENYVSKDKIKAKIEELEKEDRENRMSHNYLVIPVLQELLEKE